MEAKKNKKKKKDVQIADNNLLVQDLRRDDWVKNPVAYAQIRGDFTLMESNLMVNLVGALQDRINGYLKRKQMGVEQTDSLFTEEELNKGEIKIEIPLTDLEIRPDAYDEFDRTCEKMISVAATYEKTDEETGEQSIVHANIFSKIELPKSGEKADKSGYKYKSGQRRKGMVRVFMLADNVDQLFNMRLGYVEHLRRIVSICRKQRTPRLYIYLSKYKDVGHKLVDYNELKEYLGILKWDKDRKVVKEDKYPKYAVFCRAVMEPIKQEMDKLVSDNQIDITFTYEPRYNGFRKRGNPDQIYFQIKLSDMGRQRSKKTQKKQANTRYQTILMNEYGLTRSDVKNLYDSITEDIQPSVEKEIMALKAKVEKYKPRSVKSYVIQTLHNLIESLKPQEAEVIGETIAEPEARLEPKKLFTEEDQAHFEMFLELAKDAVSSQDYLTWLDCLKLYQVEGNKVTILTPSRIVAEYIETHLIKSIIHGFFAAFGEDAVLAYKIGG